MFLFFSHDKFVPVCIESRNWDVNGGYFYHYSLEDTFRTRMSNMILMQIDIVSVTTAMKIHSEWGWVIRYWNRWRMFLLWQPEDEHAGVDWTMMKIGIWQCIAITHRKSKQIKRWKYWHKMCAQRWNECTIVRVQCIEM